jgi:hypothetical protein
MGYLGGYIGGCFSQVVVSILWEMVLIVLPQVMMKSWNNYLWTCIGKGNVFFGCAIVVVNSCDMFNVGELKEGASQPMNLSVGV